MLLRYVNHFRNYFKITIFNENKKMINFTTYRSNKSFVVLVRNMVSTPRSNQNYKRNLIYQEIVNLNQHIKTYKFIPKQQIANIIKLIDCLDDISSNDILSLLSWCNYATICSSADKVKLANSLWAVINICNYQISAAHYNELMNLYLKNGYDFSPMELLMDMKCKHISPNISTYLIFIKYYCMKGSINKALMMVEDMRKVQTSISPSVANSLILGYSKSGDMENVNKIIHTMKRLNLTLTSETYAAIMYAYAKSNDIVKITQIIKNCNLKNVYFTNQNILNIIYILISNNYIKDVYIMYQYLQQRNISNNELQIILKLINIGYVHIAINILLLLEFNQKHPQFKSVLRLISEFVVDNGVPINDIIKLCNMFNDKTTSKKFFLSVLYYSLMKSGHLSLSLLKMHKKHYIVKPHYFWPLMIREANKYNLQGILNILEIMINDFNVDPCVETLSDYVLPFTYGSIFDGRNLLIKYNISVSIIDNAYVLSLLKRVKLKEAYLYMQSFKGQYFYEIIANELRYASLLKNDASHFINIGYNLVNNKDSNPTLTLNNNLHESKLLSIDRLLRDFMIDFPLNKGLIIKVIKYLENKNVTFKFETTEMIKQFI